MAAADYILKIDGIEGESADGKHKGAIDIESFSFSELQTGSFSRNGGGGTGKVKMGNLTFVMKANKASPKLFLACAVGEHLKQAQLICLKAGKEQQEFMRIVLT